MLTCSKVDRQSSRASVENEDDDDESDAPSRVAELCVVSSSQAGSRNEESDDASQKDDSVARKVDSVARSPRKLEVKPESKLQVKPESK